MKDEKKDKKPKRKLNIREIEIKEIDREAIEKVKGGIAWSRAGNHGSVGVDR